MTAFLYQRSLIIRVRLGVKKPHQQNGLAAYLAPAISRGIRENSATGPRPRLQICLATARFSPDNAARPGRGRLPLRTARMGGRTPSIPEEYRERTAAPF